MNKYGKWVLATLGIIGLIAIGIVIGSNQKPTTTITTPVVVKPPSAPTKIAGLPPCLSDNFFMQCTVGATGQNDNNEPLALGSLIVDTYGAGNPAINAAGDCSYLSGSPGGKDWTRSALNAWHARGKATCVVWETAAAQATSGFLAGRNDAIRARNEANELGVPSYEPIRFAVDTDTSGLSVRSYFQGTRSVLGSRNGVYGSYYVVAYLESVGLTSPRADWQTIAWSFGHWGHACLEQRSINGWLDGQSVDFDRAICSDWGQVPAPNPPIICFGKHAQGNATCRKAHTDVRNWQKAVTTSNAAYRARGCPGLVRKRNDLQKRWTWFHNQLMKHPKVKHAYREGALKSTGRALNGVRKTYTGRGCTTFANRASFYNAKIKSVEKKYS